MKEVKTYTCTCKTLNSLVKVNSFRNDPNFSDRYAWANGADPDQIAPRGSSLIRVYTVCHSVCIVWTHYSMVEPHSLNFRVITTNFWGVRIFRKFMVYVGLDFLVMVKTHILLKTQAFIISIIKGYAPVEYFSQLFILNRLLTATGR